MGMRDSVLFNPFYILSILNDQCGSIPEYCTDNFKTWLTFLYRNRGLPPLIVPMQVQDILNGTESEYLTNIQQKSTRTGGDPTIRTRFNVLPYDGRFNSTVEWEVFSGNRDPDRGRNVLGYNSTTEYITVDKQFYHQDSNNFRTGVQNYKKNPWNLPVYTSSGTEGSQFVPDMNNGDDLLFYNNYIGAMVNIDYKGVDSIFGLRGLVFQTPLALYENYRTQKTGRITKTGENPYHNYVYDDVFNTSAVFGLSYFVTEPMFSRTEGATDRLESEIFDDQSNPITGSLYYNDMIICEPYSGIVIRSDLSYQMNFFYDSWSPSNFKEFLMPNILYQRRQDIDGVQARMLFEDIELVDERMKLVLII